MDIITNNPYRYLGVYSNSPIKERVANRGKMKAYLKVGKPVSFSIDFPILSQINRTSETVAEADAKLALPSDQIKYALFWWMKTTSLDDIAFNHLIQGNMSMAASIWKKKDDVSSLQNRIVLALIQQDYSSVISYATTLYTNYAASFVSNIAGNTISYNEKELSHIFLDELIASDIDIFALLNFVIDNGWRNYIGEKLIPTIISDIAKAIDTARETKNKGALARYKAGNELISSTKTQLGQLRKLLSRTDIRYETIVDKLGLEILQCSIDYYNNSDDVDSASKTQEMAHYALSVVVGQIAKDRCKKNCDDIDKIVSELPPVAVIPLYRAISEELRLFNQRSISIENAKNLMQNTKNKLQSIKKILGVTNDFYLKISTTIVNCALNNVMEMVGKLLKGVKVEELRGNFIIQEFLKQTLYDAISAFEIMDQFDMDNDFRKNKFNRCYSILKKLVVPPPPPPPPAPPKIKVWIVVGCGACAGALLGAVIDADLVGCALSGAFIAYVIFKIIIKYNE